MLTSPFCTNSIVSFDGLKLKSRLYLSETYFAENYKTRNCIHNLKHTNF